MCLISFHWDPDAEDSLILTANRDEFFHRPAAPLANWPEFPQLYAGKDLSQGGTWLGVTKDGRFAALTNHRDMHPEAKAKAPKDPLSRGKLTLDFLTSDISPDDYVATLFDDQHNYPGFNLLVADKNHMLYFNNVDENPSQQLAAGTYGLSNGLLDTPWPKLITAKEKLDHWKNHQIDELAGLLNSIEKADISDLPDTGIGKPMEHVLSSEKIITPNYGTRCSTGLIINKSQISISEITFDNQGEEVQIINLFF